MTFDAYESPEVVRGMLLFHYGTPEQISPRHALARRLFGFPAFSVTVPLRHLPLHRWDRALELGCAGGRSTFELKRSFAEVVGIDASSRLISAAREMQRHRRLSLDSAEESLAVALPSGLETEGVDFEVGDACALRADLGTFDLVLMNNLIDRLHDPGKCLSQMPALVRPGGGMIITSPYDWTTDCTPRSKWLGPPTVDAMVAILAPAFNLERRLNLPFQIRDYAHGFSWGLAETTLWRRTER